MLKNSGKHIILENKKPFIILIPQDCENYLKIIFITLSTINFYKTHGQFSYF